MAELSSNSKAKVKYFFGPIKRLIDAGKVAEAKQKFNAKMESYMGNRFTQAESKEARRLLREATGQKTGAEKRAAVQKKARAAAANRRIKLTGRGGGGSMKMPQEYSKTALSKKTLMNKGGVAKKRKKK
tara:strand:- start:1787 stop:2173 length:387 start_codon:yes stop_codon:yes gene_type:complete